VIGSSIELLEPSNEFCHDIDVSPTQALEQLLADLE